MSDPLPEGMAWAYGAHVILDPWEVRPVPDGPTYRELAIQELANRSTE